MTSKASELHLTLRMYRYVHYIHIYIYLQRDGVNKKRFRNLCLCACVCAHPQSAVVMYSYYIDFLLCTIYIYTCCCARKSMTTAFIVSRIYLYKFAIFTAALRVPFEKSSSVRVRVYSGIIQERELFMENFTI